MACAAPKRAVEQMSEAMISFVHFGGHSVPSWLPLSAIGVVVWSAWIIRQALGARYRPAENTHHETTSVIVPIYREDSEVLLRCLNSWQSNDPDEILLVIDHSERGLIPLAERWASGDPRIRVIVVVPPGKRHALVVGVRQARFDVTVLTDSDTMWDDGFLSNLLMGFAEPAVGGVGCRQNVYKPGSSVWRRVADWMLEVRFLHYLPAMARLGAVPCISGRTAAYRRAAIMPVLDELEFETFLGKQCVSGDDGRLTWLILRDGWKAGYQMNARAWTVFPSTFRGFVKQRIRWSRNSYRCYLRAAAKGWLWRQPVITSVSVLQNLIGPFTLTLAAYFLARELADHRWGLAVLAASWLMLGRAIKGARHLLAEPEALLFLPLVTLVFIVVMIPVKFYALLTMNKQGWITRTPGGGVAEGQGSKTLGPLSAIRESLR
jgi:N-acetylglucosaminyltransferase